MGRDYDQLCDPMLEGELQHRLNSSLYAGQASGWRECAAWLKTLAGKAYVAGNDAEAALLRSLVPHANDEEASCIAAKNGQRKEAERYRKAGPDIAVPLVLSGGAFDLGDFLREVDLLDAGASMSDDHFRDKVESVAVRARHMLKLLTSQG